MADQEIEQQDFTEDHTADDFQENGDEQTDGVETDAIVSGEGDVVAAEGDAVATEGSNVVSAEAGSDAPGCDDDRKLFVGGLSWETTEKDLRDYFSKYGDIESINVKTDPNTGRSRGFSFIVFTSTDSLDKIMAVTEHTINGKKVDPKKAKARHAKIYVGGLKPELTDDMIRTYFESYGTIVEMEMPFFKQKNLRKGFCFITFKQEQVVNDLLKRPKQVIKGHNVEVKKATPKPEQVMNRGGMRGGMRGGRGGGIRGGGRGRGWGNQGFHGYGDYNQGYGGYGDGYDYGYGNYGYGGGYPPYDYSGYGYGGYENYGGQGYGGKSQRGRQQPRPQPY